MYNNLPGSYSLCLSSLVQKLCPRELFGDMKVLKPIIQGP
jgi:hypothetical protein